MAYRAKNLMVAVVDDDPRIRESIEALLSSAGFTACIFNSAEEVVDSNALATFCCLVTDVRMPGMDGWELQRITACRFPELPVIFITAHQDDIGYRQAIDLGAFGVLYKPFDGEELLLMVEAACRGYSQSCQLPDGLSSH